MTKIFILPDSMGSAEWFVLGAIFILSLLFFLLPKRFPTSVTVLLFLFNAFFGTTADHVIALEPFDLYDTGGSSQYDLFDLLIYTIIYPLMGYLFAYTYDKWRFRGSYQTVQLLLWVALSVLIEAASVQMGVYRYKSWTLAYSAISYFIIFIVNAMFMQFVLTRWERLVASE